MIQFLPSFTCGTDGLKFHLLIMYRKFHCCHWFSNYKVSRSCRCYISPDHHTFTTMLDSCSKLFVLVWKLYFSVCGANVSLFLMRNIIPKHKNFYRKTENPMIQQVVRTMDKCNKRKRYNQSKKKKVLLLNIILSVDPTWFNAFISQNNIKSFLPPNVFWLLW